jgi:hypothetical protein
VQSTTEKVECKVCIVCGAKGFPMSLMFGNTWMTNIDKTFIELEYE